MNTAELSQPNKFKAWLLAARPKTLATGFIPVWTATWTAYVQGFAINWFLAFCAAMVGVWITIGTNLFNDAIDFKKGSDTNERLGPDRVTQKGWLSFNEVMLGGLISFVIAEFFGAPLILAAGLPLLFLMIASPICGFCYTGGPFPLAYYGFGELFVMMFYGFAATLSSYYVQTGQVNTLIFVEALQFGCLACNVITTNNLRDIEGDQKSEKKTLVARFGKTFARIVITVNAIIPFILMSYWYKEGYSLSAFMSAILIPAVAIYLYKIWTTSPSRIYNKFLALAAAIQLLFGIILWISLLI
ncbi:1,4-dihydroxy-2-naphthoate octaprenyltransferase [Candidatus Rubidus massiliensis]|nr:1,4-dihydroxy-2-naphthoate octaprenyltransferase [Candidatus Rubidus massiliensis]